jgi:hypothetical protein
VVTPRSALRLAASTFAATSLGVAPAVAVLVPSGTTVKLTLSDARLLVDACWRIARARGITGTAAASIASKLADAQAGDLTAAIDRGELADLARALERLGLALRLTPALIELQEAVRRASE